MNSDNRITSPLRLAIGVGLLLSGTTILFALYLEGFKLGQLVSAGIEEIWVIGGMFLLGAIPTYVSARYRLVIPALMAVGPYFFYLFSDAERIIERRQSAGELLAPTGFELLIFFWPGIIIIALLFGATEYVVRDIIRLIWRYRTRSSNDE